MWTGRGFGYICRTCRIARYSTMGVGRTPFTSTPNFETWAAFREDGCTKYSMYGERMADASCVAAASSSCSLDTTIAEPPQVTTEDALHCRPGVQVPEEILIPRAGRVQELADTRLCEPEQIQFGAAHASTGFQ